MKDDKRSQKLALSVLVLLLTISIILIIPETNTKTTATPLIKATNSNGEVLLNKTFGGLLTDEGYCVIETSDGGYIITGNTRSYGTGVSSDVWLIKTDESGNHVWNQTYGGTGNDEGRWVIETSDGGYIITGYKWFGDNGNTDVWLIKTDANGDEEWNQTYGGIHSESGYYIAQTNDGGYIITGYHSTGISAYTNVLLIKTDANGDEEWNQTFSRGSTIDQGNCVVQTADGGYIIAGSTQTMVDSWPGDVWLIKTDENGDEMWNQTYGGTDWDIGYSVLQSSDEGYIVAGYTQSYGVDGSRDVWLIKTDANGNHVWNQTYGGIDNDEGRCVVQTSDGGYIITGYQQSTLVASTMSTRNGPPTKVLLIKTDENGNHQWNQTYGGTGYDVGKCVVQATDGGYIIIGYTTSYGAGEMDVWLLKVASGFPVIDHPADITYEEGSTGHSITWHPEDAERSSYTVTSNETIVESGPWTGVNITVSVDGLSKGVYLYTCTVNDTVGQSASDTVMVMVTEKEGGFPWGAFGLALVVIGLVAVIIYYTQYAKKP